MPIIPPDIADTLFRLGIEHAAGARWQRLDPWEGRFIRSHHFCPCGKRGHDQKLDMEHVRLRGRVVYIGQCRWCRCIYWRDALR